MTPDVPGGRVDRASRVIRAARPAIYRALIDPQAWVRWLPPEGMSGQVEAFDPRPGGRYRMVLAYRSADHATPGKATPERDVVEGRFLELVPDRCVIHAVTFESADPAFAGTMTMTWGLADAPGGVEVTFTCEDVPRGIGAADHQTGLRSSLANLAAYVEPSPGEMAQRPSDA